MDKYRDQRSIWGVFFSFSPLYYPLEISVIVKTKLFEIIQTFQFLAGECTLLFAESILE